MLRKSLALSFVAVFAVAGWLSADTKIVAKDHTDAFTVMGKQQPARDNESVTWIGKDSMRVEHGSKVIIVRLDQKKMFIVDPAESSYTVLDLPLDMSQYMPPEMAKQMMAMMKFTATVTPTDETREIHGWKARRYNVTMSSPMMHNEMTVWATKDIHVDLSAYKDMAAQLQLMQPGMADVVKEMMKIDGVQVLSEGTTKMMGAEVGNRHEVVSVSEATPPAGSYEPPAGFKAKKFDFMEMMKNKGK